MTAVLIVIHVILAVALVATILIQRSDGGALGGLGGGGSFGGVMSGRQSASFLTRVTGILAACFMGTSLILAIVASRDTGPTSILDTAPASEIESPIAPLEELDDGPRVPVED